MRHSFLSFPLFLLLCYISNSQTPKAGPILSDFGKVHAVKNPDYKVQKDITFKAVIDVTGKPDSHNTSNALIETAARFLNMHAQSGVPRSQLKVALVVHGGASKDVMSNTAYQEKYKKNNPNFELVKSLLEIDVPIIICGQSAAHNQIAKEDLISGVQLSLSAMTALVQLQNEGYQLIKF